MSAGLPSQYTPEMAERICEELMDGKSLRRICLMAGMPSKVTVLKWLNTFPEFATQYARAREIQGDVLADESLDVADDSANDYVDGEDGAQLNPENIQRARLRWDARRWYASKLAPKKYGDKLDLNHGGTIEHAHLTLDELRKRIAKSKAGEAPANDA